MSGGQWCSEIQLRTLLGKNMKERQLKKKWSSYTRTRLYLQLQEMNQVTFILVIDLS